MSEWEFEANVGGIVFADTEADARAAVRIKLSGVCQSIDIDYLYFVDDEWGLIKDEDDLEDEDD